MNLVEAAEAVRVARAEVLAAMDAQRTARDALNAANGRSAAAQRAHDEACSALVAAAEGGDSGTPAPASKIGPVITVNIGPSFVSDAALSEMNRALCAAVLSPLGA